MIMNNTSQPFESPEQTAPSETDPTFKSGYPSSKKIYVQGSTPDIQVPMREISLTDTTTTNPGKKPAGHRVRHQRPLHRPQRGN